MRLRAGARTLRAATSRLAPARVESALSARRVRPGEPPAHAPAPRPVPVASAHPVSAGSRERTRGTRRGNATQPEIAGRRRREGASDSGRLSAERSRGATTPRADLSKRVRDEPTARASSARDPTARDPSCGRAPTARAPSVRASSARAQTARARSSARAPTARAPSIGRDPTARGRSVARSIAPVPTVPRSTAADTIVAWCRTTPATSAAP